jgi:glycosyltransferase involved in cell wall biosynthesis
MRIAVVIPAYNEAPTVAEVAAGACRYAEHVFVVDDGSDDDTAGSLSHLPVTVLANQVNSGKAASLWRGFGAALDAGVDAVVTIDADGQHRPEDIPRLVAAAEEAPEHIVIGARLRKTGDGPALRRFGNRMADFWISWAAGYRIRDTQSGFRLYPADLLRGLELRHDRRRSFVLESELLIEASRLGCHGTWIAIDTLYGRSPRASHYRVAVDTMGIVVMVAAKLLRRGLYPLGLLRSRGLLKHPARRGHGATGVGPSTTMSARGDTRQTREWREQR